MISGIDGKAMSFGDGRILLVLPDEREQVERVLIDCSVAGEWTVGGTGITSYSDIKHEASDVSLWNLFIENYEDVKIVQAALDKA